MSDKLDKARNEINEIDKAMSELFVRRMRAVKDVAEYKKEHGIAILDKVREKEVINQNASLVSDDLRRLYVRFLESEMALSREYQNELINKVNSDTATLLHVNVGNGYDVHIGRGLLSRAGEIFNLNRKVLIITDSGVPKEYAETVCSLCKEAKIVKINQGEDSKSMDCFKSLCLEMLKFGMTRTDCVVAVGGGVVGDLSGFAAASYMRGIDFYNIPTTLLSQVDSSIGGKTAVNLGGVKNIVGAFYQPSGVIIDPDVLKTLPKRQLSNGLAEAIKMSLTSDKELFEIIAEGNAEENIEEIIIRSISIKKQIVEADEREGGLRKVLNFGHTLGHGIEAAGELSDLYHGECVAIGMMPVCSADIRSKVKDVLDKYDLPTRYDEDIENALSFISKDKKCDGKGLAVIFVDEIGSYRIEKTDVESFCSLVREEYKR